MEDDRASLTHLDDRGQARMVDVADKEVTHRVARARAIVRMSASTADRVARGDAPKGDVSATARIAGIMAAKRTHELIPLAHPLPMTSVSVDVTPNPAAGTVEIETCARATARTGVEMEALTAASVAALTIYDMVKGIERGVVIERIELLEKTGGKHDWSRQPARSTAR